MNYIDQHKRPRRILIAIAATLAINGWLIYALLHGNIYPFAAPEHLIRVRIFPDTKHVAPERGWMPKGLSDGDSVPAPVIPPTTIKVDPAGHE